MTKTTRKPVAVLIADVHYNPNTLAVADAAMRMAIDKANELGVPFIVAGDLHDTKALLRGECIKAMIETFKTCKPPSYVVTGNHDKINEKGEDHSLEFLRPYVTKVVDNKEWLFLDDVETYLLPYYSDSDLLREELSKLVKGSLIICHQGVLGANMGHYVQDKTSLPPEAFADFRVISGHYHKAQDIKCGRPRKGAVGLFSYIGNPYTLTFGEANDGPKGFQILYSDGLMEQVPTSLRKHVIIETETHNSSFWLDTKLELNPSDLLWLKIKGPVSDLQKLKKKEIGQKLLGHTNFKLDLIPIESERLPEQSLELKDTEILDNLIQALPDSEEHKKYLKGLWREIL